MKILIENGAAAGAGNAARGGKLVVKRLLKITLGGIRQSACAGCNLFLAGWL